MLPVGAFAVALLLNGAQILLPAPAFVEHGRTWAPARAIFQRLGDNVRWDTAQRAMIIQRGEQHAVFTVGASPILDGQAQHLDATARRVGDTIYVPLVALRALGLKVQWDSEGKSVHLKAPTQATQGTLAAILADPLAWNDQEITLIGEYSGWDADPFCFATRQGPPVSSGDWVLHNEDGSIYCSPDLGAVTPAAPSLTHVTSALPPLTPYTALGQRFAVTGTIKFTSKAIPYLLFSTVRRPVGVAGVTRRLVLDRQEYEPGEKVAYTILLANPQPTRVVVGEQREWLVSISGPDGQMFVSKESFSGQAIPAGALAAGEQIVLRGAWTPLEDAAPGIYVIAARLNDEFGTYRRCFTVQSSREAAPRPTAGE